jgi:Bacterial regulatory protein, Fis family
MAGKGLPRRLTTEQVAEALRATNGNVAEAARRLTVSRQTLYVEIRRAPEVLEPVLAEGREAFKDLCEKTLEDCVREGDGRLALLVLDRIARERGYGQQVQVTIPGPIPFTRVRRVPRTIEGDPVASTSPEPVFKLADPK